MIKWPASVNVNLHMNNREEPVFELTEAKKTENESYRVLRFVCGLNNIDIFLDTEQAKEIAGTILAQLESEKEAKAG
jgi:hypothetical protein